MKTEEINQLLKYLDWYKYDETTRFEMIQKLYSIKDLSVFLRPQNYGKEIWDGCARILVQYNNNLIPYLNELFEWLDNEDNPGFFLIHERLTEYTFDEVKEAYQNSLLKAKQSKNLQWQKILENMHFKEQNKIEKEIRKLSWDEDQETQEKAINNLLKVKDLRYFLQNSGKDTWENCARILLKKTNNELFPYLKELFEWLQDKNWPGYYMIKYRLEKFPYSLIQNIYLQCINEAKSKEIYEPWFENLKELHFQK